MGDAPDPQLSGAVPPSGPNAAFLLQATGRVVRVRIAAGLRARGTSLRHTSALGHLSRQPGLSYSELARRAGVTVQSMQATVEQLQQRSLVERRTPAGRGRLAVLRVTPAGTAVLREAGAVIDAVDAHLFEDLSADDRRLVTGALARVFTTLERPVAADTSALDCAPPAPRPAGPPVPR